MSSFRSNLATKPQYSQSQAAQRAPQYRHQQPVRKVRSSYTKKRMSPAVYWVLLAVALFVVFQCARSILVDTSTLIARVQGQPIIERYYEQTRQDNRILRERIKSASTRSGIEAMARNYLNLTGKDEILVVFR